MESLCELSKICGKAMFLKIICVFSNNVVQLSPWPDVTRTLRQPIMPNNFCDIARQCVTIEQLSLLTNEDSPLITAHESKGR